MAISLTSIYAGQPDKETPINENFEALRAGIEDVEAWILPTFANSWTHFGVGRNNAGYRLRNGRVELQGAIASGSGMNTTAFTLPAGYRPAGVIDLPCDSNNAYGKVLIGTDGTVKPYTGTTAHFSLEGISFDAA